MKRTFFVAAHWDSEANVYYSDSDIDGLHIEASSLDEFESLVVELAPELIIENHPSPETSPPRPSSSSFRPSLRESTSLDATA